MNLPVDSSAGRRWYAAIALLLVAVVVVHQLRPILSPFVVGALIAYLGDPATDWLESRGLGRGAAASVVFLFIGIFVVVSLLITLPLLIQQLDLLVRKLPALFNWFTGVGLPQLQQALGLPVQDIPAMGLQQKIAENWQSLGKILARIGAYVTGSSVNLLVSLGNLVLIPVVAFYLLRDWDKLMPRTLLLIPRAWQAPARDLAKECDEVIGAFLRGQFLVMLGLGGIYAAGLWLIGLELAFLIGVVAGLASVVPYLGTLVGIVAAVIAGLLQFQDPGILIWIGLVFTTGQMLEGYVLTPKLVGGRIGLHPVAVIFAVLAGGQLAGFVGILLALPVAAVVMVFLRHLDQYYKDSELYTDAGDV